MIKCFVFDIGNVVWNYQQPCQVFHDSLARLLKITPDLYRQKYLDVFQAFETDKLDLTAWCQSINPKLSSLDINRCLQSTLSADTITQFINQEVADLILRLKSKYTIGSLSNAENFFLPLIHDRLNFLFDFQILSSQVGLRKPDPKIYQEIFKHGQWSPGEVVFVDDKPENVSAASAFGLNAFIFQTTSQLLSDLKNLVPLV